MEKGIKPYYAMCFLREYFEKETPNPNRAIFNYPCPNTIVALPHCCYSGCRYTSLLCEVFPLSFCFLLPAPRKMLLHHVVPFLPLVCFFASRDGYAKGTEPS